MEQLRDGSLDTYWQSDGPQPHLINIQFRRKMSISDICIYADYKADESYTPNRSVMCNIISATGLTYLDRVRTVLVGPAQFFTLDTDDLFSLGRHCFNYLNDNLWWGLQLASCLNYA